jgi:hypothetical protein
MINAPPTSSFFSDLGDCKFDATTHGGGTGGHHFGGSESLSPPGFPTP